MNSRATRSTPNTRRTLEEELEGELHLPAPLLVDVASKISGVVYVSIRRQTICTIQYVIRREPELHIERFANRRNREILEQRSIPVKLLASTEHVASEAANVRTVCITRENPSLRTSESSAIQLETLSFLYRRRRGIANQIHAPSIARHVKYWSTLPRH